MPEWKEEIRRRLAQLNLEPTREAEIVEELAQHLDDRYLELLSGGATEEQTYRAALAELSESELLARELRRIEQPVNRERIVLGARRRNMVGDLWQDLRYAARAAKESRFHRGRCGVACVGDRSQFGDLPIIGCCTLAHTPGKQPPGTCRSSNR
jgi:hypothetical protein